MTSASATVRGGGICAISRWTWATWAVQRAGQGRAHRRPQLIGVAGAAHGTSAGDEGLGVEELVGGLREDDLRYPGGERGQAGAGPAVMHDGRAVRQRHGQWQPGVRTHRFGQRAELGRVSAERHQHFYRLLGDRVHQFADQPHALVPRYHGAHRQQHPRILWSREHLVGHHGAARIRHRAQRPAGFRDGRQAGRGDTDAGDRRHVGGSAGQCRTDRGDQRTGRGGPDNGVLDSRDAALGGDDRACAVHALVDHDVRRPQLRAPPRAFQHLVADRREQRDRPFTRETLGFSAVVEGGRDRLYLQTGRDVDRCQAGARTEDRPRACRREQDLVSQRAQRPRQWHQREQVACTRHRGEQEPHVDNSSASRKLQP